MHSDVSPGNVMVGFDGSVKLLDFGTAAIKGKPSYMSPEQCLGAAIDRRSDVFSLGTCLFELTTLRHAFTGGDDLETMSNVVSRRVVPPSRIIAGYPGALESIVMTAMANDPAARFQTAEAMLDALEGYASYAQLPVSPLALGRFVIELFGAEPDTDLEEDTLVDEPLELPLQAPTTYASGELEVIDQPSPVPEVDSVIVAPPRRWWTALVIVIALLYLCFARSASTRLRSGSPFFGSTIATKLA